MGIEIRQYSEIDEEEWNDFCLNSDSAWFQHTSFWIEYTMNMCFQGNSINRSFGVFVDNQLQAVVVVIEEDTYGTSQRELAMSGFPCPYPAFENNISKKLKKRIEKDIFEKILSICEVDYINFYVCPLIKLVSGKGLIVNPIVKWGFHDTSLSTNILALNQPSDEIYRSFRKGCKSDIKLGLKSNYHLKILDKETYSKEKFLDYKEVHFNATGRKTRPDETWECMEDWVKKGLAVLALVYDKEQTVIGAAFVNLYKKRGYYQSGAILPEYQTKKGIGHLMQWEIIRYLEKIDCEFYELGWNWNPNISQEVADLKMLGISRFKRGFGGEEYPLFRGEFFKNKSMMKRVYKQRLDNYASLYL